MAIPPNKSLVLFDGFCHLCSRSVQLILKFDRKEKFVFAPLSGDLSKKIIAELSIPPTIDSIILVENDVYYTRSLAIIRIAQGLGGIFKLASVFSILPTKWLDFLYDKIASHRLKWFGQRETCILPKPEFKDRFL